MKDGTIQTGGEIIAASTPATPATPAADATTAKARIRKIKAAARAQRKAKGEDDASRTIKGKSATQLKTEVRDLLDELRTAKTTDDKKRIRRALRARGHVGGLGGRKGYEAKVVKKTGRRANKPQVIVNDPAKDAVAA